MKETTEHTKITIFTFSLMLSVLTLSAQSDGTDAWAGALGARASFGGDGGTELFLGGNYIELGISNSGDFGTIGDKPAGFRGTNGGDIGTGNTNYTNQIGLSQDYDGFENGDDNPVDFYLPGSPVEGFEVGYDSGSGPVTERAYALNTGVPLNPFITVITNTSNTATGSLGARILSTWTGVMTIQQDVSFGVNDSYFTTEVTITNISGSDFTDARYKRYVDPDNTRYRGGEYTTRNTVTNTIAEDAKAVVKADTSNNDADPIYVAEGLRMPFFYYSTFAGAIPVGNNSHTTFSPDTAASTKGFTADSDSNIAMIFVLGALANGASETFTFITSLDSRDFDTVLEEVEEKTGGSDPEPDPEPEPEPDPEPVYQEFSHVLSANGMQPMDLELDPNGVLAGTITTTLVSGSLPDKLKIEGTKLTGWPKYVGTYNFVISQKSGIDEVRNTITLTVVEPSIMPVISGLWFNEIYHTLNITQPANHGVAAQSDTFLATVNADEMISIYLDWDFIKDPCSFIVIDKSNLPEGLTLIETTRNGISTCHLTGSISTPGDYTFQVSVKDWRGRAYQNIRIIVE